MPNKLIEPPPIGTPRDKRVMGVGKLGQGDSTRLIHRPARAYLVKTAITSYLSTAELEGRYETAADPIAKSHFHAIWLLARNYTIGEVAEILSFSSRWGRLLVKRYNEHGPDSLGDRREGNGTAPTILTSEALSALNERLKTPPDDGGLWTGPKSLSP